MNREDIVKLALQSVAAAFLVVFVFPAMGKSLDFFKAVALFAGVQLVVHGLTRFLMDGEKGFLIVSVFGVTAMLLLLFGLIPLG